MSARDGRSLTLKPTIVVSAGQVGQVSLKNIGQSSQRENWDYRVLRDNIDFLNELGVNLVVDDNKQTFETLGNATTDSSATNWFLDVRSCRRRSSSPSEDYADRNLGSIENSECAMSSRRRVKFIHIAFSSTN